MKNIKSFIELEFDEYGDMQDRLLLGGDYYLNDDTITCDGEDISCQDGFYPICNWKEYSEWKSLHEICDRFPYECPDPENCFYSK